MNDEKDEFLIDGGKSATMRMCIKLLHLRIVSLCEMFKKARAASANELI